MMENRALDRWGGSRRRSSSEGCLKRHLDMHNQEKAQGSTIATEPLSPEESKSSKSVRDSLPDVEKLRTSVSMSSDGSSDANGVSQQGQKAAHIDNGEGTTDNEEELRRELPPRRVVRSHSIPQMKRLSGWELRERARDRNGCTQRKPQRGLSNTDRNCELPSAFAACATFPKRHRSACGRPTKKLTKPKQKNKSLGNDPRSRSKQCSFTKKRQPGVLAPHEISGVAHITDGIQKKQDREDEKYDSIVDKVPFDCVEFEERDICDMSCSTVTASIGSIERRLGRSNTGDFEFDTEDLGVTARWESKSPTASIKDGSTPQPRRKVSLDGPDQQPMAKASNDGRVPGWKLRMQAQTQGTPAVPARRSTLHDESDSPLSDKGPAVPKRGDKYVDDDASPMPNENCKDKAPLTPPRRTSTLPLNIGCDLSIRSSLSIGTASARSAKNSTALSPKPIDAVPPAFAAVTPPARKWKPRPRPGAVNEPSSLTPKLRQKKKSKSCPPMRPQRRGSGSQGSPPVRPQRRGSGSQGATPAWELRERFNDRDKPLKTPTRRRRYSGEQIQVPSMFQAALS